MTADGAATPEGSSQVRPGQVQLPGESFRSVRIEMVASPTGPDTDAAAAKDCKGLADGTAFFYRVDGKNHVVTARHNLTGRHWETNEPLGRDSPTHVRMMFIARPPEQWSISPSENESRTVSLQVLFQQHLLPLIGEDWKPIWKQHPHFGPDMDVAVVPLNPPTGVVVIPWEPRRSRSEPGDAAWPQLSAGHDVFIIGYPYRISVGPMFPLWMRGTVASEPSFGYYANEKAYPLWLIDARTRSGQSGSPVMRYRPPGTFVVRNDGQAATVRYSDSELLGVYAGRTSDDSDIGFVWPIDEVDEICREGVQGTIF